jgi:hypothetical protein
MNWLKLHRNLPESDKRLSCCQNKLHPMETEQSLDVQIFLARPQF